MFSRSLSYVDAVFLDDAEGIKGAAKKAKPDAIVMHPGPVNRGIEVDSSVADGPQSVILKQVTNGIAVRMAAMEVLAGVL